jgi:hypothetical protein
MRNVHRIIGILLLATGLGGCMVSERPKGDSGSSGKRTHFFPALPHGQPFLSPRAKASYSLLFNAISLTAVPLQL